MLRQGGAGETGLKQQDVCIDGSHSSNVICTLQRYAVLEVSALLSPLTEFRFQRSKRWQNGCDSSCVRVGK